MRRLTLAATAALLAIGLAGCTSATDDAPAPGAAPVAEDATGTDGADGTGTDGTDGTDTDATAAAADDDAQQAILGELGLAGMTVERIVDDLDRVPVEERSTEFMASIRVDELIVTSGAGETSVAMPDDRFYLSVAPYVDETHECFYHSLTTCLGELGGVDVQVTITADSGAVLVDEQVTTFDNGFVGFWLPRDVEGTVTVAYDGLTGEVPFSTGPDGATCVADLQLT